MKHHDVNPNTTEDNGGASLGWGADYGNDAMVQLWLDHKVINPNFATSNRSTALLRAAKDGNIKTIRLLLKYEGINPNTIDGDSRILLS